MSKPINWEASYRAIAEVEKAHCQQIVALRAEVAGLEKLVDLWRGAAEDKFNKLLPEGPFDILAKEYNLRIDDELSEVLGRKTGQTKHFWSNLQDQYGVDLIKGE